MIMRVSNASNREVESERERRYMRKKRLQIRLRRSPTTSMHEAPSNLYSSTVHHAVPRLRIILDYARSCLNTCILSISTMLHTRLQNEQGKMCDERWWRDKERRVWGDPFMDVGLWWIDHWVNFWDMVGWSVGHLSTRTRFSPNEGGTVRYKSTLERTWDG